MLRFKRMLTLLLALVMMLAMSTTALAADNTSNQQVTDVDMSVEVPESSQNARGTIQLDDLLENSVITSKSSSVVAGTYVSDDYGAGLAGYTFQIEFDWEAEVNSSGDYIFKRITNANIETTTNYIIIGLTWAYSSYDITENTYTISSNKKSVTFNTTYLFEFMIKDDITGTIHELEQSHSNRIVLNDLL
ncbi:MAG: hypothetical protein ACK5JH_13095 [Anaerocolumna sp.]